MGQDMQEEAPKKLGGIEARPLRRHRQASKMRSPPAYDEGSAGYTYLERGQAFCHSLARRSQGSAETR